MRRTLGAMILLGLAGVGYYAWTFWSRDSPPVTQAAVPLPVPVQSELCRTQPVTDELLAFGNLRARLQVTITAPQPGQLRELLFTDGSTVAADTPLVVLDNRVARAQVDSARARLLADQQNLRRTQNLARQGLESTRSVEQAQSEVASSLSTLKVSEARLELTTLRAPFDGTLGTRHADVGAMLNAADKIVDIEDRLRLLVEIRVPSRYLPQLRTGMQVALDVPNLADDLGRGTLTMIDSSVSADTRSILLRADIDNAAGLLTPGLFVRVVLPLAIRPNAVVVPEQAVVRELVSAFVFVLQDGVAKRRAVQIGNNRGGFVEVKQGLRAGERVVTTGAFRLRDGDRVTDQPLATAPG